MLLSTESTYTHACERASSSGYSRTISRVSSIVPRHHPLVVQVPPDRPGARGRGIACVFQTGLWRALHDTERSDGPYQRQEHRDCGREVRGHLRYLAALHGPDRRADTDVFEEGFGFDGSSIRGWKSIEASDMLAVPDPATAFIDPFADADPLGHLHHRRTGTKEAYNRDPRGIAQGGEKYLKSTGSRTRRSSGRKRSSSFSTMCSSIRPDRNGTFYFVDSSKAAGTAGAMRCPTSATRFGTRKVISRSRRPTRSRTSAPRCA